MRLVRSKPFQEIHKPPESFSVFFEHAAHRSKGNCRRLSSACFGRGHGGDGGVNHEPSEG